MKLEVESFVQQERRMRIEILADVILSFKKHLNGKLYHTRIPEYIVPNKCVLIGKLEEDIKERRNEHLVPLAYLLKKCFEVEIENRADIVEILSRCLLVVNISKDIQVKLDKKYKNTMPEEWCAKTGNVFARLEENGYSKDKIQYNENWDKEKNKWKY